MSLPGGSSLGVFVGTFVSYVPREKRSSHSCAVSRRNFRENALNCLRSVPAELARDLQPAARALCPLECVFFLSVRGTPLAGQCTVQGDCFVLLVAEASCHGSV